MLAVKRSDTLRGTLLSFFTHVGITLVLIIVTIVIFTVSFIAIIVFESRVLAWIVSNSLAQPNMPVVAVPPCERL